MSEPNMIDIDLEIIGEQQMELLIEEIGPRGPVGPTPNIQIGTVQSVPPTQEPEVTVTGTPENPLLNFKLKQGEPGDYTQLIDDTTGTGDTDRTWSADKLTSEFDSREVIGIVDTPADIVTVEDAADDLPVRQLKVAIEPVQDLHGYDHPWPGGAGKNLYSGPSTVTKDDSSTYEEVALLVPIPAGTYYISAAATLASGVSYARASFRKSDKTAITYTQTFVNGTSRSGGVVTLSEDCYYIYFYGTSNTSVKSPATFADIQIEEGSTATAYEPYSNICPITGWTEANVDVFDENFFGSELEQGSINAISGTIDTGANYAWRRVYSKDKTPLSAGTYTISCSKPEIAWIYIYSEDGSTYEGVDRIDRIMPFNFTLTANKQIMVVFAHQNKNTAFDKSELHNVVISSAFQRYTVTFPSEAGTVYGGELTINRDGSGTLVVDRKYEIAPTSGWLKSGNSVYITRSDKLRGSNTAKCSHYSPNTYSSSDRISIDVGSEMTAAQFAELVAEYNASATQMQILYKLATPITYTLTAPQVKTLLGLNNLWADTGKVNYLAYYKDTPVAYELFNVEPEIDVANDLTTTEPGKVLDARQGKVLNDKIEENNTSIKNALGFVEDGDIATRAIAKGQYVIWKDALYTADAAISIGETLAASGGSKNLTSKPEGAANALNASLKWQLLRDNITGGTVYAIPSGYNEYMIEFHTDDTIVSTTIFKSLTYRYVIVKFTASDNSQIYLTYDNTNSTWTGTNLPNGWEATLFAR